MPRIPRLLSGFVAVIVAVAIAPTVTATVRQVVSSGRTPDGDSSPAGPTASRGLSRILASPDLPGGRLEAIAKLRGARSSQAQGEALRSLGLQVQLMRRLPLALVRGTRGQLVEAVRSRAALDVYPNEALRYYSAESNASMRANIAQVEGIRGGGVGVAIVDTGIDATHPDLTDHVTHNMKIVSPEYASLPADAPPGPLVIPMDQGPYNNSDLGGHGTHVAGIVAADGHTSPEQTGVAPDAELIGYSTGEVLYIFSVVAAFDHILENREEWGIRVVNNSWGSSFRLFDPSEPIHVATKALHDAGVVVVFAAGNGTEEMTLNPYSAAPWVISAGAATVSKERAEFSSGGLEFDNSEPIASRNGSLHFDGDGIGQYHPDVSAPGADITSSGTPTGVLSPAPPGGATTLSGTSMASPHVAGVAALLLQARPDLTPDQVRDVLQVTAGPMSDDAEFWQSGYGFVDVAAALSLVKRPDFDPALLAQLQSEADVRMRATRRFSIRSSDFWSFPADPVTVEGIPDSRAFEIPVTAETKAIKAMVAYPSLPSGVNVFDYRLTLKDTAGEEVAQSKASELVGVSTLFVDLTVHDKAVQYGTWKLEIAGTGASDDDGDTLPINLLGKTVSVTLAQLAPRQLPAPPPRFVPTGLLALFFQPDDATPLVSPEGCSVEEGAPSGGMEAIKPTGGCQTGLVGSASSRQADLPAQFTSGPLSQVVTIGGEGLLTLHLVDSAQPAYSSAFASNLDYTLEALDSSGNATPIASGTASPLVQAGPAATRGEYLLKVPPTTVAPGALLRLQLRFSGIYTSTMRLLYGGRYGDSGLTLTTGQSPSAAVVPAPPPPTEEGLPVPVSVEGSTSEPARSRARIPKELLPRVPVGSRQSR